MTSKSHAEKPGSVPAAGISPSLKKRLWFAFAFLFFANSLWPLCFPGAIGKIRYLFGLAYRSHCRSFVKWTTVSSPATSVNDVYHMRTSLSLPLDAETLVFNAAETNLTYGRFEVSATAPQGSTEAIVEVEVFYTSPEAFNNVTMCGIHNPTGLEGDTWGLGIFGSRGDAETRPLRVHIHLRLPAPGRAPAQLGRLKTDLPHFSQTLHNLTATAFLEELSLHGSHGPVFSESTTSKHIRISGTNASIGGTFTATSRGALLWTYNASIVARINLIRDDLSEESNSPGVTLIAANGEIQADIGLFLDISNTTIYPDHATLFRGSDPSQPYERGIAAGEDASGRPHFFVSAHATNAPLALAIADAPPDVRLALSAISDGAPARVTLHPTYEGVFALKAAPPFVPELNWPRAGMADPAGRGLTLVHEETYDPKNGWLTGWVGWGLVDEDHSRGRGNVWVAQSRGEAVLGWGPSDDI